MKTKFILFFIFFTCSLSNLFGFEPHVNHAIKLRANYVRKMAKEKKLILTGYGGALFNDIEQICVDFTAVKKVNIDEARNFFLDCVEELMNMMNSYREMRPYLHNFPVNIHNADVTIRFQNQKLEDYTDGSVTYMFYRIGKIFYSSSTETEHLVDLYEETYEEALKKWKESSGST